MKRVRKLFNIPLIDKLSSRAGLVAAVLLIAMMVLITVEVILRKFFGTSTKIAHDFSAHLYVAIVFLGVAETLRSGKHLRVTVIMERFGRRFQSIIYKINVIIATTYILMLLWFSAEFAITSYQKGSMTGTIVEIPEFIPEMFIPIGLLFFTLQLVAHLIREFRGRISERGESLQND